jgi:hypothetical protein
MWFVRQIPIALCLFLVACSTPVVTDPNSTSGPTDADDADGTNGSTIALTGQILPPDAAKVAPRSQATAQTYMIVAQSDATGTIYRGTTDASGEFQVDIPEAEAGNTFMITILGPDGQAVGPVLFGVADGDGLTGLELDGEVSLGTIALPDDPGAEAIEPGSDADELDGRVDAELTARLDANGVPIGLASHGKGDAADADGTPEDQVADGDEDGLIDMLDADDDGDGVVDDLDGDSEVDGAPSDVHVNFFMNLKIGSEQAPTYYAGTAAEIAAALAVDTIITLECVTEPSATRAITAVHALETPGPSYLPEADKMLEEDNPLDFSCWADLDYAFDEAEDRFQAFVRPNAVMDAGDTFTIEASFDDGTTQQYSRMINYVFKKIPKLVQYGTTGALVDFDVTNPGINGSPSQSIPFDGTQDLMLVFNPPLDETGAYLTGLDYTFQIFYYTAADGPAINDQIDIEATWPDPLAGFEGTTFWVASTDLTLSPDDTYTFALPKELFPGMVQTTSGGEAAVAAYKIDITAECPSGNAAIMLMFQKN